MTIDYYEALGVDRSSDDAEIKRAYRRLALKHHPDRNPGNREAEEHFKKINEAYSCLSDPQKRENYDRFGSADGPGAAGFGAGFGGGGGFADVFEDLFGGVFGGFAGAGGGTRPAKGSDLRYDLEITLEEAVLGVDKKIKVPRQHRCDKCEGSGSKPGKEAVTCPACEGRGEVRMQQGFFSIARTCGKCGGKGEIITDPCPACRGAGKVQRKRTVSVKIPAGIDSGMRLKMTAEGELGVHGGPPGDLYIIIEVIEHPLFSREGNHLICSQPITFTQAALGAEIQVPVLDGNKVSLKIPAGTESHKLFRLRGKGVPSLRGHGRGDQIVQVVINVPKKLSEKQKSILKEFAEISGDAIQESKGLVEKIEDKVRHLFGNE